MKWFCGPKAKANKVNHSAVLQDQPENLNEWMGLHFGNTNTSATIIQNLTEIELVRDPQTGDALMPSVVSVDSRGAHKVGREAVACLEGNQKQNVIFQSKYLLGTKVTKNETWLNAMRVSPFE